MRYQYICMLTEHEHPTVSGSVTPEVSPGELHFGYRPPHAGLKVIAPTFTGYVGRDFLLAAEYVEVVTFVEVVAVGGATVFAITYAHARYFNKSTPNDRQ